MTNLHYEYAVIEHEDDKSFTIVFISDFIVQKQIDEIEQTTKSKFKSIAIIDGILQAQFKFITDEEQEIRKEIAFKIKKAEHEGSIKTYFKGFKCNVINGGRKDVFTSFDFDDKDMFFKFMKKFKPVDTIFVYQKNQSHELNYRLTLENGVNRKQELKIRFKTEVGIVWVKVPANWVPNDFIFQSSRKVTSSENHYFPRMSSKAISEIKIPKNIWYGNCFHWYGGSVDLVDSEYADTIVETMISSLKAEA